MPSPAMELAPTVTMPTEIIPAQKDFLANPRIKDFIEKDIKTILHELLSSWQDDLYGMIEGVMMYSGQQWLARDNGQIVDFLLEDQEASKLLYTNNYMGPLTDQVTARILSRQVSWTTVPASTDESDVQRSKANNKILKYIFEQRAVRRLLKRRAQFITQMGRAYISAMPDFNSGVFLPDAVTQAGVPVIEVHSPIEVMQPIDCFDNQKAPFMVRWRWFPVKQSEKILGRKINPLNTVRDADNPLALTRHLFQNQSTKGGNFVLVPEIWIHPDNGLLDPEDNPKGLVILFDVERNEPIEIKEWDYPFSGFRDGTRKEQPHYPFHDCPYRPIIHTARCLGVTQLLVEKQRHLNRVETMIAWHINISSAPILLRDPDGMSPNAPMIIEAGRIWDVRMDQGRTAPSYMQPPRLNSEVVLLPAKIKDDMRSIVNVRDVSLAGQGGADSGIMWAQMQAQDNQNFSHFTVDDDGAMTGVCSDTLKETHAYMPAQFKLEVLGHRSGPSQLEVINTQQIDPMIDVIAVANPNSWEPPSMKESRLLQRATQGLITKEDFLQQMDGRDPEEDKTVDLNKVLTENEMMERGQRVPPPGVADNDDVHLEQHSLRVRSVEFLMFKPEVQQLHTEHFQFHKARKDQAAQQTAMAAPVSKPTAPVEQKPKRDLLLDTQLAGISNARRGAELPQSPGSQTPV